MKTRTFVDLVVWQQAHKFVLSLYQLTKSFPDTERYGLVTQLRRAGVSVTSNIAEGYTRFGRKNKAHFYTMSQASLTEIQNQLILSRDLGYISSENYDRLWEHTLDIYRMLNILIRSVKVNP
ncbi:four helix bundle protein [Patescibacteria group bacterium]|nr:four helix bundle protein [Patescibacteria group bacterium]MBU1705191.1 four helix bundle protein [Patescibacteria group bacterium]